MKNLFSVLPEEFFKPLTSKYKREYADCILLIYNTYKPEISYGINRSIVAKTLTDYFELDDVEMSFEDEDTYVSDAREKANGVIAMLKSCGWLEYEQETDHQLNVLLCEYTVPIIESLNRVIREEETEYQGIISQIHASLQNQELYSKPYELIIKGVQDNTEHLISELKRLNASIKRHMDRQTNEMDAVQVLDHFFEYHQNIGSKAYLRMKTSENISYFRSSIIEKLEEFLESQELMDRATSGYMEIEQVADRQEAYDRLVNIILDVKTSFYRLDEIIAEIDRKHTRYMHSAVMRAKFLLSTGNNIEGKLSKILDDLVRELNREAHMDMNMEAWDMVQQMIEVYPQRYLSPESLQTINITRKNSVVDEMRTAGVLTEEERELHKEALRMKNRNRFSRKNINEYVIELLKERERMSVAEIPIEARRDLIRIIYISIYAGNLANNYRVERKNRQILLGGYSFPDFDIVKK